MNALRADHPFLLEWNSHFFVVYGPVYTDEYDHGRNYSSVETSERLLLFEPGDEPEDAVRSENR